ncbi:sigma factor [Kribbella sp. NPDC049584]|uniref:sigma factor n=1 Tax=Kribbella sp. NPDC049584 TaxID=3154833 RepID=UPI00342DB28C
MAIEQVSAWEDIYRAQDVFLRAFRYLHTYKPGNFDGWLCRITTNLFRDRLTSVHRIRLEALPDDAHDTLACGAPCD